jgi:hypothetical protein
MNAEHQAFEAFNEWDDIQLGDSGIADSIASFYSSAASPEEDDASSIASNDDEPIVAASFPKKSFPNFEDLRASVSSFARLALSQVGDNSRCASKVDSLPTKWLRDMFPTIQGSVKYSGFLYCKCKGARNCDWKVHYKLQQNGFWVVQETSVWEHNHELDMLSGNVPAASGLVHLKNVSQLAVEHKTAIISFLDAGLTVKVIRFKFRAKFPGYELRARCCKTVKESYLKNKYGTDRHQMSKFMQQLHIDCNPAAGGVCAITYEESMEIAEIYFQMPLLRKVGEYFGKFSVIDMSHNMSMYERNMATFNVMAFFQCSWVFEYTQTLYRL